VPSTETHHKPTTIRPSTSVLRSSKPLAEYIQAIDEIKAQEGTNGGIIGGVIASLFIVGMIAAFILIRIRKRHARAFMKQTKSRLRPVAFV
jgi:hypothetical protein